MGWNGSGSITLLYDFTTDRDAGAPDNIISADKMDAMFADVANTTELTLNRNGENVIAANISWGSFRITTLGAATAATDAVRARQVAENVVQYGGSTGGSGNAYTATMTFLTTVATGTRLLLKANHSSTGAATLNVNAAGAVAIVRSNGTTAITTNDIVSGDFFEVAYDGTSWVLLYGGTSSTSVNNSNWSGTDLAVVNGGTGSSTAADARTALGLAIGSNVQAYVATTSAIAALAVTDSNFIVGNGSTWVAESGATVRTSLGLGSLATLSAVNNSLWSGTDLAVANGGTGASDGATALSNLGLATVSQAEAEAGTATTTRAWTAERVKQSIAALQTDTINIVAAGSLGSGGPGNAVLGFSQQTWEVVVRNGSSYGIRGLSFNTND